MKQCALLFCIATSVLTGCNNKMKNEVEVSTENNIAQDTLSQSSEKDEEKILTVEKIAEIANNGDLETEFPDAKIKKEILKLNEGQTRAKVLWLYPNTKDEVRIDFKAEDSSTVWRVTIDNKKK